MNKVIITCAVTGAIHTPSMSPYLPVTPEEIIEASVEAAQAGAATGVGCRRVKARGPSWVRRCVQRKLCGVSGVSAWGKGWRKAETMGPIVTPLTSTRGRAVIRP